MRNFFFKLSFTAGLIGLVTSPRLAPASPVGAAAAPQPPLAAGAEAFRRGDWPEAIREYQTVIEQGAVDPNLYYNLGTAYAQSGDPGRAIWMLLRAKRLAPRDPDIHQNLDIIVREYAKSLPSQVAMFPFAPVQAVYAALTLNEWAVVGAGGTVAFGLMLAIVFMIPSGKAGRRLLKRVAMLAFVTAAIGHVFAGVKYYEEDYTSRGIIVARNTQPRAAPSDKADTYEFILAPGTVFRVENSGVAGWIKVIYGAGNEVFIRRDQMEFLQAS